MIGLLKTETEEVDSGSTLRTGFERLEISGEEFSGPRGLPAPPPPPAVVLSMQQKAAVILSTLGPEPAAQMLRSLSVEEVRAFARASSSLADIPKDLIDETIIEFIETLDREGLAMTPDKLKRILAGVMSDDQIERIFEDIEESEGRSLWDKLATADVAELANFLSREHPQTVAVVVSKLRPERAAKVMSRLDAEFADEVVLRLSKVAQLQPETLDAVKATLQNEFLKNARQSKSKRKPDELIGSIMNFLPNEKRDQLLKTIEDHSEPLAVAVQRKMFTFGDIPIRVDRANVSTIVREIDNDVLVRALQSATASEPATVEFFMVNISKRLAEQIQDMMDETPKPSPKEGEEAQFAVIDVIRRMADRGEFKLNMGEDDDDDGGF